MKRNLLKVIFVLCLGAEVVAPANSFAQNVDLDQERLPIAVRRKQPSTIKFSAEGQGDEIPFGVAFNINPDAVPSGAGKLDFLLPCPINEIHRYPIPQVEASVEQLDFVFYSPLDAKQVAKAKSWPGLAVPYIEGWPFNPYKNDDVIQDFSRTLNLRCLPTRFRVVRQDSEIGFTEYREGERAWDK